MNAVASYAGLGAPCPSSSYDPPPASSCVDAPTFGTLNGAQVPCASLVASASASSHLTPEQLCDEWLGRTTLDGIVAQERAQAITYVPPAGVDPAKTLGWELCRGTCLAAGTRPCWLRAPFRLVRRAAAAAAAARDYARRGRRTSITGCGRGARR